MTDPAPVPTVNEIKAPILCSLQIDQIAAALAKAQGEMGAAIKDKVADVRSEKGAYKYGYATLAAVLEACRAPLSKAGLAVFQTLGSGERSMVLTTTLVHTSGQWVASELPVEPTQRTPQAMGSAITYARRYTLSTLVGVAPDDDDGAEASQPAAITREREQPSAAPAPDVDPIATALASDFIRRAGEAAELAGIAAVAAECKASPTLPPQLREQTLGSIRAIYAKRQPPAEAQPGAAA